MNYSQKLLTELKAVHGLPSDGRAAALLGLSKQSISNIVQGRRQFCDESLIKIAKAMEKDPIEVLAEKYMQGESVPQRLVWEKILDNAKIAQSLELLGLQPSKVA